VRCGYANQVFKKQIVRKELNIHRYPVNRGHAVAQLVGTLRYKSEGRGFCSRWCHWNFSLV